MFACEGRAQRLDKACPVAIRCLMIRVYVYPLLTYCCEALPLSDRYVKLAHRLLYKAVCRMTGVRGKPDGAAIRMDCGLPDLSSVIAKARAQYLMVIRSRAPSHLTRLALKEISSSRRGALCRLWLRKAEHLLGMAGVDLDSGLGGHKAGLAAIRRNLVGRAEPCPLRAPHARARHAGTELRGPPRGEGI